MSGRTQTEADASLRHGAPLPYTAGRRSYRQATAIVTLALIAPLLVASSASAHQSHARLYKAWHDSNTSTPLGLNFRNQLETGGLRAEFPGAVQKWNTTRITGGTQQGTAGTPCSNTPPQGVVCVGDATNVSGCWKPSWSTVCIGAYADLHSAPDGHAWRGRIEFNGYNRTLSPGPDTSRATRLDMRSVFSTTRQRTRALTPARTRPPRTSQRRPTSTH